MEFLILVASVAVCWWLYANIVQPFAWELGRDKRAIDQYERVRADLMSDIEHPDDEDDDLEDEDARR